MTFWVYENTIHQKCRVHRSDCSFCNDGNGIHGGGHTLSGNWLGPFPDLEKATETANNRKFADVRGCSLCVGNDINASEPLSKWTPTHLENAKDTSLSLYLWDQPQEFSCSLSMLWIPIGRLIQDAQGKLRFPKVDPKPGLYRLRTKYADGRIAVYIGESSDLRRKFGNYRNPGPSQVTNLRINGYLKEQLAQRCEISVSVITETAWFVDGDDRAVADHSKKAIRRLFEQWAISAEGATDIESLNR